MPWGGTGRALLALIACCVSIGVVAEPADAAATPVGRVISAVQNTFVHSLRVTGWAYDPARPGASVTVRVYVDGSYVGSARADRPSPQVNAARHISGAHRYVLRVTRALRAAQVTVRTRGVHPAAPLTTVGTHSVAHYYPPPGARIIYVARLNLDSPYREGGATPAGFDCSGYTKYAYAQARVKTLVHSADGQRRSMRRIARSNARPGDLVFYLSGGSAYHVAIYAGHGRQYAAATVRDGIRYQPVWSSNVVYGTNWH